MNADLLWWLTDTDLTGSLQMNNSFYLFCIEIGMVGGRYPKIKAVVCLVFDWALAVLEIFLELSTTILDVSCFSKSWVFGYFFSKPHIYSRNISNFFLLLENIRFHFCVAYNRFLLYSTFPVSIVLAYVCLYTMCTQTHTYSIPQLLQWKLENAFHV